MKIEQIYTGCLAQGAYYITSNGEAAIVDPLREIQPYLDRLEKDKVKLKYIFETHFHADFVSGHLDLSTKTGATIVYGPTASPAFSALIAEDNQILEVGKIKIKVLHTPGHTMESSCYLVSDEEGRQTALFSGDTLFLGDVGRPDLAQKAANLTQEELAGLLYDSLYQKIIPLDDNLIVYPAHGAGSACGKNMMAQTVDSLGNQKKVNYALNQIDKTSFIKAVTEGLLPPPAYFGMNVAMNKSGYTNFDEVLRQGKKELTCQEVEMLTESTGAIVLDTRRNEEFAKGFIPKSINIGIDGDFASWVGALLMDVKQALIIVADEGREEEIITRLSRVGFDHVLGMLKGGFASWEKEGREVDSINRVSAEEFAASVKIGRDKVIDLRRESEYAAEHIEDAYSRPLAAINSWMADLVPDEHFFMHCAGGYRSAIAASILQARGYRNFTEVAGGFSAISKTNVPKTNYVCQSKLVN